MELLMIKYISETIHKKVFSTEKNSNVLQCTAHMKIHYTSVRMSAGIPVDMSILQSNRNNPKK